MIFSNKYIDYSSKTKKELYETLILFRVLSNKKIVSLSKILLKIAYQANNSLNKNGLLYFEINEKFGKEIVEMLTNKGFVNIELKKDINDKDRMVKATKK